MRTDPATVTSVPPAPDLRIRIPSHVLAQEVAGEAVLLDPVRGLYFGLDEVGAAFWRLLREHELLSEVHAALAAGFDVAPERLWSDLEALLSELEDHELVEIDPA